jgi:hypothetical protein
MLLEKVGDQFILSLLSLLIFLLSLLFSLFPLSLFLLSLEFSSYEQIT